jgi:hypothetical protein
MSEEQSPFKVTDRRLFNPDGSPREIERDEPSIAEPTVVSAQPEPDRKRPSEAGSVRAESHAEQETYDEEQKTDADNPSSFVNFLMSIASNAASSLGMMEHPVTGERGVDLAVGKHWIDILGMLEQKTRGNLNREEAQILEGILADLRMQFVSLTGSAQKRPQSYTANDILGGK